MEVGASLDYHRYYRTLVSEDATLMKRKNLFLNYHTKLKYETLDKRYFPTKGLKTNIFIQYIPICILTLHTHHLLPKSPRYFQSH